MSANPFTYQPPVQGVLGEFGSALLIILVGILLESGGGNESNKRKRISVVLTLLGLIAFVFTTEGDLLTLLPLIVYSSVGVLIAIVNVKQLFWLFGSKTYGSFMLAIAIFHIPDFQKEMYDSLFRLTTEALVQEFVKDYYLMLVFVWFIIAVIVWFVAWVGRK